jgi:DNA-binding transcriptional regulator YiaG
MATILFQELGLPVLLVDPPMVCVRGQDLPDVNLRTLQESVFALLVQKPTRLSGEEVRFIRKHLRLRQADLAELLNLANHSVVSQWESRDAGPAGMDYNTEVLLRLHMAARSGQAARVVELLEHQLKGLKPAGQEVLQVRMDAAG